MHAELRRDLSPQARVSCIGSAKRRQRGRSWCAFRSSRRKTTWNSASSWLSAMSCQPMEELMKEWVAVLRAADAAARWHAHQRRKGASQEPYINHLLEVASLVAEATEGKNAKVVIAALLHDAIEDQEVPRELIAQEFGEDVAALVQEVSDDKELEKHERKRLQIETAHKKSDDAKRIKLADKTSN